MTKWTIFVVLVYAARSDGGQGFCSGSTCSGSDFKLAEEEFDRLCEGCHGERGEGGDGAPATSTTATCAGSAKLRFVISSKTELSGGCRRLLSLSVNCAR